MSPKNENADGRTCDDTVVTLVTPVCIRVNFDAETNEVILVEVRDLESGVVCMPADYLLTVVAPAVARAVGRSSPSP